MTASPTLGILTIGQSPRNDIVPVLRAFLPSGISLMEIGCLDGLADDQIAGLGPRSDHDGIETRLRDGKSVVISKFRLESLIPQCLDHLPRPVLFVCSSTFTSLENVSGVIRPDQLILPVISHVARGYRLGVIGPASDLPRQPDYWHPHAPGALFAAGSPNDSDADLIAAAQSLDDAGCSMLFLDCMGFREDQRRMLRAEMNLPVIAATTLVGRMLPEFL
jgi:protein AroM